MGREGVGDAVGAHVLGVLVKDLDARLGARSHDHGIVPQVAPAGFDQRRVQRGHDAGDDHSSYLADLAAAKREELGQLNTDLVGGAVDARRGAPVGRQLLTVVERERDVGVADVDGEQHVARGD